MVKSDIVSVRIIECMYNNNMSSSDNNKALIPDTGSDIRPILTQMAGSGIGDNGANLLIKCFNIIIYYFNHK